VELSKEPATDRSLFATLTTVFEGLDIMRDLSGISILSSPCRFKEYQVGQRAPDALDLAGKKGLSAKIIAEEHLGMLDLADDAFEL